MRRCRACSRTRHEFYADFADYRYTVDVPAGWVLVGTGTLENAAEVDALTGSPRGPNARGRPAAYQPTA